MNPLEEMIAHASADYVAELIQNYDIKVGMKQIAVMYRPTDEFVAIFQMPDNNDNPYDFDVPFPLIMLELSRHSLSLKENKDHKTPPTTNHTH